VSLLVLALVHPVHGQTYKVGAPEKQESNATPAPPQELGWGSNIQNARLARAAEQALKSGNYSSAVTYAQQAADGAPNDPQLWFLLGYVARLARRSQLSIDAYDRGLRLNPSSLEGLSGLAQTYNTMGRRDEAEHLLRQVLSSNPRRTSDADLLGEILMQSGEYDEAIDVLGRGEQGQPNPRSELLIAFCYQRLKQFDRASHYLELAKRSAPRNPEVVRALSGFYREMGNYPAAIAALKSIPHQSPDITAELAYTYQLFGKVDEAATLYAKAADAATSDLNLQLSAAEAEINVNALEQTERFLKRAAAVDPEHYRLHSLRGRIANLEDRDQDAAREYEAALAHLPPAPPEGPLYGIQLHMDLMSAYRTLGDDGAARRNLDIAQSQIDALDEHGAARPQFLRLRALIRLNAGDFSGAGSDIKEALAINPKDTNNLQLSGDLLIKLGELEDATAVYKKVLVIDSSNRLALTSLGYVSRETGHDREAEKYFERLASAYPRLYVPHLALGDLYTARHNFGEAQAAYRNAYELSPGNSLIIAGGMNAAIEAHQMQVAAEWLKRASAQSQQNPFVMREKERYFSFLGDYQQSYEVGEEAIKKLPRDRDVVVYLGYDMLHLERYDELLQLTSQYAGVFPKEPDIPLLAGYVHKHDGRTDLAEQDFTDALERDANVPTAYVNRGFVFNDTHRPKEAASDFEAALKLEPKNGEAHLGLAYASLNLHRPRVALQQVQLAKEELGDSLPIHLIRATAFGEEGILAKAASEYRTALTYSPNDSALHLALAGVMYSMREYRESIGELQTAVNLTPENGAIYAQMARSYAQLQDRDNTLKNVNLAEQRSQGADPKDQSAVLLATGEALSVLGDHDAAMERFGRALAVPDSDRVGVRLAVAKLMADKGEWDDARRQIALALMESADGRSQPPTAQQFMQAADVFLGMHDFELAQKYFQQALTEGASDTDVRVGLANTYLAVGDTTRAEAEISSITRSVDDAPSYQYLLAKANVYRQQHQNVQALTAFAQAASAAGEDQTAEQALVQAAGDEGLRINRRVSVLSDFSVEPIFEDTTVYPLDAKLDVLNPIPGRQGLLPDPRSSLQTQWTGAYHLHLGDLPDASGFFQVRNARGQISLPSADTIINRDTTDYSFNIGLNPTVHLGQEVFTFNGGVQETIRRDSLDPVDMNQNLFRQFLYMSTSSFFNFVSLQGYAIREAGPFVLKDNLRSRDLTGALDFRVGRPWGTTALVTGWGARDEQFFPLIREFYYTSAYVGLEHRFSQRLNIRAVAEDLRAWRVEGNLSAIAQALRPAGSVQYAPTRNWSLEGSVAYSRNMGFHAYDAVQTGFAVSYATHVQRAFKDEGTQVELRYPIRFSAGMQQEDFFNFPGANRLQLRPYVRITLF
jgi:predicted Zn-dependent protease